MIKRGVNASARETEDDARIRTAAVFRETIEVTVRTDHQWTMRPATWSRTPSLRLVRVGSTLTSRIVMDVQA